jgi:hypothetical protein
MKDKEWILLKYWALLAFVSGVAGAILILTI